MRRCLTYRLIKIIANIPVGVNLKMINIVRINFIMIRYISLGLVCE